MRTQLRPVAAANDLEAAGGAMRGGGLLGGGSGGSADQSAWVRNLRSKLRKVETTPPGAQRRRLTGFGSDTQPTGSLSHASGASEQVDTSDAQAADDAAPPSPEQAADASEPVQPTESDEEGAPAEAVSGEQTEVQPAEAEASA